MGLPASSPLGALPAEAESMLHAVLALTLWTFVVFVWMYATRLPAMARLKIDPQAAAHPGSLNVLPSEVRRIADNFNHLHEGPTVFYAVVLALVLLGLADGLHAACAWAYVGARIAHSLVQATLNRVALRFLLFVASWAALALMIVRAAVATWLL